MSVLDHAIGLIQTQHVNHGQFSRQIGVAPFIEQLPETTGCRNNDRGVIGEETLLLLDRHASDQGADLDLVLMVHWYDSLDVLLDLDGQLTSRTHYEGLDGVELFFFFHELLEK